MARITAWTKEPWQVTQRQFLFEPNIYDRMSAVLGKTKYPAKGDYSYMTPAQASAIKRLERESADYNTFDNERYEAIKTALIKKYPDKKISIEMSQVQINPATHQLLVEQALLEGKPVPAEVLKDYPDLQKKAFGKADKITINEMKGQSFTVTKGNMTVDIYYDGNKYWCNFKPFEKANAIASTGITDKETAVEWAKLRLKEYGGAVLAESKPKFKTQSHRGTATDKAILNRKVISPDNTPLYATWKRDPGRYDVQGIDTPSKDARVTVKQRVKRQRRNPEKRLTVS